MLDVKQRSSVVRAARVRLISTALGVSFATVFGFYVLWRLGGWALDEFVYENKAFAIRQVDVQTDGVISTDQLRRWSGVKAGENLLALDLSHVKRELELVPAIQSVSLERILPGTLRLRVTEREPLAQIDVMRPRSGGGMEMIVFQMDENGYVMLPLDPRQRVLPLDSAENALPEIWGVNFSELQPGRRVDSPPVHAALKLIAAFESSQMADFVELKSVNVSSPQVLVAKTTEGEITFGLDNFDQQLRRWRAIRDECLRLNKVVTALDLSVTDSIPLRFVEASAVPPIQKNAKPQRNRKRNV